MISQILKFLGSLGAIFGFIAIIFNLGKKNAKEEIKNKQNEAELKLIKNNNEIKERINNLDNSDIIDGL